MGAVSTKEAAANRDQGENRHELHSDDPLSWTAATGIGYRSLAWSTSPRRRVALSVALDCYRRQGAAGLIPVDRAPNHFRTPLAATDADGSTAPRGERRRRIFRAGLRSLAPVNDRADGQWGGATPSATQ
jgi:hypothetical protein